MTFLTLAGRVLIFNRFACFVALRLPSGNFFPSFSFLLVAFFPNLNKIKSFIIFLVLQKNMQQVRWAHLSVTARVGNTIPFQELSQQWRAVGKTVSNLTGLTFEHHPSRSRDKGATA